MEIPGGGAAITPAKCISACKPAGYKVAGVKYGSECYCSNEVLNDGCAMPSNGSPIEPCGGRNRLNLYLLPQTPLIGKKVVGCHSDFRDVCTLHTPNLLPGDFEEMTIEKCMTACGESRLAYDGPEFTLEYWCDSQIDGGAVPAPMAGSNMVCTGDAGEFCSGDGRISVFTSAA